MHVRPVTAEARTRLSGSEARHAEERLKAVLYVTVVRSCISLCRGMTSATQGGDVATKRVARDDSSQ